MLYQNMVPFIGNDLRSYSAKHLDDLRIVLLSGTPIFDKPLEIGSNFKFT